MTPECWVGSGNKATQEYFDPLMCNTLILCNPLVARGGPNLRTPYGCQLGWCVWAVVVVSLS